jgi:hypothetical protein
LFDNLVAKFSPSFSLARLSLALFSHSVHKLLLRLHKLLLLVHKLLLLTEKVQNSLI